MKHLLIGIGSPHGDDQLGWIIIDELSQRINLREQWCFYKSNGNGSDWYSQLSDHDTVVFIDALLSPKPLGSIIPLELDELERAFQSLSHSTHGVPLSESILLADRLGLLKSSVLVFGISVGTQPSIHYLSEYFTQSVTFIADQLLQTIK